MDDWKSKFINCFSFNGHLEASLINSCSPSMIFLNLVVSLIWSICFKVMWEERWSVVPTSLPLRMPVLCEVVFEEQFDCFARELMPFCVVGERSSELSSTWVSLRLFEAAALPLMNNKSSATCLFWLFELEFDRHLQINYHTWVVLGNLMFSCLGEVEVNAERYLKLVLCYCWTGLFV